MHLHLNPVGGLAGDMFCAALLDAFPEHVSAVREAISALDMPARIEVSLTETEGPIGGKRFRVTADGPGTAHHRHTPFRDIRELLELASLPPGVRSRALAIFSLLAEAEGKVHRIEPELVEFHEVGSWDSIADILGSAVLLEELKVEHASCAPLPLGSGRVQSAHGVLPVPAPATALLLEGLPVTDDGIPGERVTPTGAAILRSLTPTGVFPGCGILTASGLGFGTRELPGVPNCLQILALETSAKGMPQDPILSLRFEVDDQTPEDLAIALEHLRATAGVLSVTTYQAIGKGGRATMSIQILIRPETFSSVVDACFRETTTIGVRWQPASRITLTRSEHRIMADGTEIGVKLVDRPGGPTAKAESRDLAARAGHAARAGLARLATDKSLETDRD